MSKEKYYYGLDRALILDKSLNPITSFNCGDNILCPTFFGYTWATITNENSLWATNDVHFFLIERVDGLYKLSLYGDNKVLEMIDSWDNDYV